MADKFDVVRAIESIHGDNLLAETVWFGILCARISNQTEVQFRPGKRLTSCS
jgi:hypothetical protein